MNPDSSRVDYSRPAALKDGAEASSQEMRKAFEPWVSRLIEQHNAGVREIAVQGQISSMKSWLLTTTAQACASRGEGVMALAPQRVNRRNLIGRLEFFDAPYLERPSRRDLCAWDAWLESVGRVDERTCSTNGCARYPRNRDMAEAAAEAIAKHSLTGSVTRLDEAEVKRLADTFDPPACPHYLLEAIDDHLPNHRAVRVATHAKLLSGSEPDGADSGVVLVDESHAVGAMTELTLTRVDVPALTATLRTVSSRFAGSAHQRVSRAGHDLEALTVTLEAWEKASHTKPVTPDELLEDIPLTITDAFDAVEETRRILIEQLCRGLESPTDTPPEKTSTEYYRLQEVTDFLSKLVAYRDGDLDFIHTRYTEKGHTENEIAFRAVHDSEPAVTPQEIYEAWTEQGTHPAIDNRWGGLLDHHLEAVWRGRELAPGG